MNEAAPRLMKALADGIGVPIGALREMAAAIQAGERDYAKLIHAAQAQHSAAGFRPDYLEVREATGLRPATADDQHLVILLAAFIGSTRLIDNLEFQLG